MKLACILEVSNFQDVQSSRLGHRPWQLRPAADFAALGKPDIRPGSNFAFSMYA
jgi:hypothetical protein